MNLWCEQCVSLWMYARAKPLDWPGRLIKGMTIQYNTYTAILAGGRLIKGMTGKLRSDDTARLSRGVAVSSSHLSSSSFLWSFTHFISGNPDLKIWSFGAFFISQTNKSGIKRTRKQHGHKSSYWSLTFRWIQSTCWKNYCDKIGLLKNTDLQKHLYQSHIGSMIGLWNISLSQCIIALMFLFPISSLPPWEFKGTNFAASVVWPQASPDVSWYVHIWRSR